MRSRLGDHPIFVKIDLFVLDRTPETLDKDVVVDPAVHADSDPRPFQKLRILRARKLRARGDRSLENFKLIAYLLAGYLGLLPT
jgi:hypothetical protein